MIEGQKRRGAGPKEQLLRKTQVRPLDITIKSETFHLHVPATAYLKKEGSRSSKNRIFYSTNKELLYSKKLQISQRESLEI